MYWLFLTAISLVSSSVANLFQRLSMKDEGSDPITSAIVFQLTLAILSGIFAFFVGFNFPPLTSLFWNFLVSACLYGLGTIVFFKAMKTIGASEKAILAGFGSVVVILFSWVFLGEMLTKKQLVGAFAILLSIVVIQFRKEKTVFSAGARYALVGTTLYGIAVVNDSFILQSYDAISFMPVMSFLPALFLILLYPKSTQKLVSSFRSTNRNLWIFSFLYAIQGVAYYSALDHGGLVSQISTIFKIEIVLTVLFATMFLNEKDRLIQKACGALLALIGVFLIK